MKTIKKILIWFNKLYMVLSQTFIRFNRNQGFLIANGLTFKTVFAMAPALVIIAWVFKNLSSFSEIKQNFINLLKDFILPSSFDLVTRWIDKIFDISGTFSLIGILIFIYLTMDLLFTIDIQIERIWSSRLKQSLIKRIFKYWALISATPFLLGGYFYYSGLFRSLFTFFPILHITYFQELIYVLISFFLLGIFFFILYYVVPSTNVDIVKSIIVSAIVAAIWIGLRSIVTYYTSLFLDRWTIVYSSFATIIAFVIWASVNWMVLLFGVEFLCVWQNKLYFRKIDFSNLFLFDLGFIIMILDDFYQDFLHAGHGIMISVLADKYKYNHNDIKKIFKVLEDEGFIVGDQGTPQKFFLKKNLAVIQISELEHIVWKRLIKADHRNSVKLDEICKKIVKYYYKPKAKSVLNLTTYLKKSND